ncbi:ImmA/IrrE family metallo-endopeptidase [Paenibacillus alba]|uniref:ImmA/IrrE family metallo-endopeptidase n=1 Tax=Paenibacillus alba TaxID=1197127 RepID=UPI0015651A76|nr:ImmA/IrrE family metallo-endopeptidase [Paenibacillus alba]NQX68458.1 ImmA/IrrE family metallo-endopeptidase [Paenibacillus alba]
MDYTLYQTTHLEDFVDQLYKQHSIWQPAQLTIHCVAAAMGIRVHPAPISYIIQRECRITIHINENLDSREQWQDFLHELCHALRHAGNQLDMPPLMREWQEIDAFNFAIYASIPYFMIRRMKLPDNHLAAIHLLTSTFHVTEEMAYTRLLQIQRRIMQGVWDKNMVEA